MGLVSVFICVFVSRTACAYLHSGRQGSAEVEENSYDFLVSIFLFQLSSSMHCLP